MSGFLTDPQILSQFWETSNIKCQPFETQNIVTDFRLPFSLKIISLCLLSYNFQIWFFSNLSSDVKGANADAHTLHV